jgi:hypothetical protein
MISEGNVGSSGFYDGAGALGVVGELAAPNFCSQGLLAGKVQIRIARE